MVGPPPPPFPPSHCLPFPLLDYYVSLGVWCWLDADPTVLHHLWEKQLLPTMYKPSYLCFCLVSWFPHDWIPGSISSHNFGYGAAVYFMHCVPAHLPTCKQTELQDAPKELQRSHWCSRVPRGRGSKVTVSIAISWGLQSGHTCPRTFIRLRGSHTHQHPSPSATTATTTLWYTPPPHTTHPTLSLPAPPDWYKRDPPIPHVHGW